MAHRMSANEIKEELYSTAHQSEALGFVASMLVIFTLGASFYTDYPLLGSSLIAISVALGLFKMVTDR